jgi:hypothetical protein
LETKAQLIARIVWNINDAKEALENALDMSNWDGVIKYANQLKELDSRLYDAERYK